MFFEVSTVRPCSGFVALGAGLGIAIAKQHPEDELVLLVRSDDCNHDETLCECHRKAALSTVDMQLTWAWSHSLPLATASELAYNSPMHCTIAFQRYSLNLCSVFRDAVLAVPSEEPNISTLMYTVSHARYLTHLVCGHCPGALRITCCLVSTRYSNSDNLNTTSWVLWNLASRNDEDSNPKGGLGTQQHAHRFGPSFRIIK